MSRESQDQAKLKAGNSPEDENPKVLTQEKALGVNLGQGGDNSGDQINLAAQEESKEEGKQEQTLDDSSSSKLTMKGESDSPGGSKNGVRTSAQKRKGYGTSKSSSIEY